MPQVTIKRSGNLASAEGTSGITSADVYKLLHGPLSYGKRVRNNYRESQASGKKFRTETNVLSRYDKYSDTVLFPTGMRARATGLLEKCGITVDYVDLSPSSLPAPELDLLEHHKLENRPDQQKCLATMFSSDMGVIESPTAWGKTFTIEQYVRAYPTARIIVCSYRRDVVESLYDRLKPHVSSNDLGMVRGGTKRVRRVTMSTVDSLGAADPEKCQAFLYDEVHEAASDERMKKIGKIRHAKMFGFSASPRGRTDGADLAVEAMFGPVIYKLPYQAAEAAGTVATIDVDLYRIPGSRIPYDDDTAMMRYGLWRNEVRNRQIAAVAARYATEGKQVLIMVDKLEHALAIKSRYLPEWPVVHGTTQAEQIKNFKKLGLLQSDSWLCTQDRRAAYRRSFESGKMRFAISTMIWSQGVDTRHLDVLVRADGGSAAIKNTQIPGRLARGQSGLLVDFDDVFDERFKRRSDARIRHYKGHGWNVEYVS